MQLTIFTEWRIGTVRAMGTSRPLPVVVTLVAFTATAGAWGATGRPVASADNPPAEIAPVRAA